MKEEQEIITLPINEIAQHIGIITMNNIKMTKELSDIKKASQPVPAEIIKRGPKIDEDASDKIGRPMPKV